MAQSKPVSAAKELKQRAQQLAMLTKAAHDVNAAYAFTVTSTELMAVSGLSRRLLTEAMHLGLLPRPRKRPVESGHGLRGYWTAQSLKEAAHLGRLRTAGFSLVRIAERRRFTGLVEAYHVDRARRHLSVLQRGVQSPEPEELLAWYLSDVAILLQLADEFRLYEP